MNKEKKPKPLQMNKEKSNLYKFIRKKTNQTFKMNSENEPNLYK